MQREALEAAQTALARSRETVAHLEHELAVADGAADIDDRSADAPALMTSAPTRARDAMVADLNAARGELAKASEQFEAYRHGAKRASITPTGE